MYSSTKHHKAIILSFSLLISMAVYFFAFHADLQSFRAVQLTELYGFISLFFLLLAMVAGPFYRLFPNAPLKNPYRSSLGGLGISAFYFAFLHSSIGFFSLLAGFPGLAFLPASDLLSVIFGFAALLILAALAGTSFVWAMNTLGRRWKTLHRFVYAAALFVVLHVLLIGAHFRDFTDVPAAASVFLFILLLVLEAAAWRNYLVLRNPRSSRKITALVCADTVLLLYLLYTIHAIVVGGHIH